MGEAMEITAVEQRRPVRETPAQKLARESAAFAAGMARLILLVGIVTPFLLASFLTLDLPVRSFDRLFDAPGLKPGLWLSVGGLIMTATLPLIILITRRFGGDEASRVVTASWGLAAVATFAELSRLAPAVDAEDMPRVSFVLAYVASAMLGQYAAIGVYDITRGGGAWWRPPLLAALIGYAVHGAVYFPWAYASAGAPWFAWMVCDLVVKTFAAFAFLGVYALLQKPLRPSGGYGG